MSILEKAALSKIASLQAGQASGFIAYQTKALLDADLAHAENTPAMVTNDSTATNNGYYIKVGGSGSGSWTAATYDTLGNAKKDYSATICLADVKTKGPWTDVRSFGATGDGVTDDTTAIQNALSSLSQTVLFPPGTYLTSGNDIPSDKTLIFMNGSKLKLKDASNRPALQNENWQSNTDKNITVIGLYLNGNDDNQSHHLTDGVYANEFVSGIRFFGVTNLTLKNITISRAKTFGIWCCNLVNLIAENIRFDQKMTGTPANQDGLHLNGPVTGAYITNIIGSTNDDMIALNADDGSLGSTVTNGAITNVIIDGVNGVGCLNGIRLLSATSRIDRIQIKNIVGSYRDPAINLSAYEMGIGNFGMISIDGVNCDCSNAYAGADYYGVIVLNNYIENIVIRNVQRNNATDNRASILVLADADIKIMEINGLSTYSGSGSLVTNEKNIHVQGLISYMILSNVKYTRYSALAQNGCVMWINGSDATKGIKSLVVNNLIANRCINIIHHDGGLLNKIMITNALTTDCLAGGKLLELESLNATTEVSMLNCNVETGRSLVGTLNGATYITGTSGNIDTKSGIEIALADVQSFAYGAYRVFSPTIVVTDRLSEFSTSTFKFIAKQKGCYVLNLSLDITVPTQETLVVIRIMRNGSLEKNIFAQTLSESVSLSISSMLSVSVSDAIHIEIYCSHDISLAAWSRLMAEMIKTGD